MFAGSVYRGSGYWANTSSNLPGPRADFVAVPLGDEKVFIVGGQDSAGNYLSSALTYDAVLDIYNTSLAAMPQPRARFAAAAVDNNTIIVVGGYKDNASAADGSAEACPLIYKLSADTWIESQGCMPAAVADACAAGLSGKLYVAGGSSQGKATDAIYSFDPSTNTWAKAASLPSARADAACAALGSTLYVAGGRSDSGLLNELVAFDTSSGQVHSLAPLPYGSGDVELVALPSSRLLAIGGLLETNSSVQAALHYVQEYSPALDAWVEKAPIATSRLRAGAAYANGGVYAFGGLVTCTPGASGCSNWALADVEVFYDVEHPGIFVHLPNATAASNSAAGSSDTTAPQATVLLSSSTTPVNGFTNAGLLHAGSGYWAEDVEMPNGGLSDIQSVPYGSLIFIPGGTLPNNILSGDLWQFDTELSQYTQLAALPSPRTRYGAAILDDKLYVVGGFSSNDSAAVPAEEMLVYDIAANTWSMSQAGLVTPRSDACMAALDGKLYIGGGYSANFTDVLATVEVYDPDVGAWTEVARPMPTPRGDLMCAAFQSKFLMVGGYYDPTGQWLPSAFRTEVEAYDPKTGDWTTLAPIPQARGDNALVQLPGDRMMVMGGETNTQTRTEVATSQVDLYLAAYDLWVPMAPMPEPRFRFDAAFANGFVYAFGGQASSVCDSAETCTERTRSSVAKYLDIDYPDVFVYVASA
ncbi:hypothetical protein N2152v2_007912 [Parachlorella kessleri]